MPRLLDEAVYYATAPIRLFGRSRGFRLALAALCTLALFVYGALLALDRLLPAGSGVPPQLAKIAPPPPRRQLAPEQARTRLGRDHPAVAWLGEGLRHNHASFALFSGTR